MTEPITAALAERGTTAAQWLAAELEQAGGTLAPWKSRLRLQRLVPGSYRYDSAPLDQVVRDAADRLVADGAAHFNQRGDLQTGPRPKPDDRSGVELVVAEQQRGRVGR